MFKDGKEFLLPYLLLALAGIYPLLAHSASDIILWVNRLNHPFWDHFFYYITIAGDGIVAVIVIAALLFVQFRAAIVLLVAVLLETGIVHLFKRIIFHDSYRPYKVLQEVPDLHLIPFVKMYTNNSFPSGHTALAFTLYTFLALWFRNSFLSVIFLIVAVLVGYSRMYLFQHFFADVYAGSVIGVLCTCLALWLFRYKRNALLEDKIWPDKSFLKL